MNPWLNASVYAFRVMMGKRGLMGHAGDSGRDSAQWGRTAREVKVTGEIAGAETRAGEGEKRTDED